jgi:hypothetical protein
MAEDNLHKAKRGTRPDRLLSEESLGNQILGRRNYKLDLGVHLIDVITKLRLRAAPFGMFHNESLRTRMRFLISMIVEIIMPITVNK